MKEQMPNMEYHRGEICPFKCTLCQEGYCSECSIYRSTLKKQSLLGLTSPIRVPEIAPVMNMA
jgi:hypothetical protein